jgi:glycosyltransferase involved in cell wall biosynthesis
VSRPLRVGMLLDHPFPPDPRVANEARALVKAGHEVQILCLGYGSEQPAREEWQGVGIRRARIGRWFHRKASAVSLEVPAYRWFIRRALRRFVKELGPEVLHVHDLPMVSEGVCAARRAGIPLVADLHENWPAALKNYGYARRFPGRILISPERWARHERGILPHAERIIVVIEEARERILAQGIDPGRIVVVRNTVEVDDFRGFGIDEGILERFRDRFVLSYLGGFERHRGIETAIEAMPAIAREIPSALLLLIGKGSTESSLRALAERLGVADRVVFEGYQPFRTFPSYIAASVVCLIPHLKNDHTDTTIPHKLFHYMLLGRPVLTSDCRPLRRIVEETGCGIVYPSGDHAGLAAAVARMADPALREAMGAAGQRAVREKYNWSRDAEALVALYRELDDRRR